MFLKNSDKEKSLKDSQQKGDFFRGTKVRLTTDVSSKKCNTEAHKTAPLKGEMKGCGGNHSGGDLRLPTRAKKWLCFCGRKEVIVKVIQINTKPWTPDTVITWLNLKQALFTLTLSKTTSCLKQKHCSVVWSLNRCGSVCENVNTRKGRGKGSL